MHTRHHILFIYYTTRIRIIRVESKVLFTIRNIFTITETTQNIIFPQKVTSVFLFFFCTVTKCSISIRSCRLSLPSIRWIFATGVFRSDLGLNQTYLNRVNSISSLKKKSTLHINRKLKLLLMGEKSRECRRLYFVISFIKNYIQ